MRNPYLKTSTVSNPVPVLGGAFVAMMAILFGLLMTVLVGAVMGLIIQMIWNNISTLPYHITFYQAWGGYVIAKLLTVQQTSHVTAQK